MKRMKLIDVCDFQGGSQPPKDEWSFEKQDGYIRMLQIRDFTQSDRVTPEYIKISNSTKICEEDDILIARYGASIGKILTGLAGAYNVAIMRTIPDISKINKRYLYYYLKSDYFQNAILNVGSRAAQAGFNKEDLAKLEISCPSLSKQQEIINILYRIEVIIENRKRELIHLENLIKARFIELFGNLVIGDRINTNKQKIGDIASVTKLAGFEFTKYIQYKEHGDIIMLRGLNCKKGHLILDDVKWIDKETSDLLPRSKLYYGDILMTYAGTIGDVAMVDADDKYHLAPNVAKITLNDKKACNPVFLMHLFMYTNDYIMTFASVVAQASINMEKIRNFEYYLPSVETQNQFAAFVEQIDKSKVVVQKALDEAQLLFDSLMQKYFG